MHSIKQAINSIKRDSRKLQESNNNNLSGKSLMQYNTAEDLIERDVSQSNNIMTIN